MMIKANSLTNSGYLVPFKRNFYGIVKKGDAFRFVERDESTYEITWELYFAVNDFRIIDQFVFVSSTFEDCTMVIELDSKKEIYTFSKTIALGEFNLKNWGYEVFIKLKEELLRLNLINLSNEKRALDKNLNLKNVGENRLLFSPRKSSIILAFDWQVTLKSWQLDLSDLCAYDVGNGLEKAELSKIYSDDEFVYLLAGLSVVKVSIQSGEIIWHVMTHGKQSRGLLKEGFLYASTNAYITKINTDSGELIYHRVAFDHININNEKTFGPIQELVWYRDSIWTIMDSNPSALIEINPNDGSYKSVIPLKDLGITRDCHMPRFHDNRMYILDFDNTLHIFEMETDS